MRHVSILAISLGLTRALPDELATWACRALLLLYLFVTPGVRREIALNLHRLFPELSANGHHSFRLFWMRQAWRLGANLALMVRIGRPALNKLLDNAVINGENIVEQIMLQKGRVVVLSLHYGLWELLPQVFAHRGYPVCVGMGELRDRAFAERLMELRGSHSVTMTESLADMRQAVRKGSLVGFVLDNTSRTRGLACDAFAPGLSVLRTPFALARAEQAQLVPMFIYQDRNVLRVEVQAPVASEQEFGLRARELVRRRPEDWVFWGKN